MEFRHLCVACITGLAMLSNISNAADTDADGIPDVEDNCILVPNGPLEPDAGGNVQLDADGDMYGNSCDPDFNGDLVVNASDLAFIKANFFSSNAVADLDGSGVVNAGDLAIVKSMFFQEPGPSGLVSMGIVSREGVTITFDLPADWSLTPLSTDETDLYSQQSTFDIAAGNLLVAPDIAVILIDNMSGMPLSEFVDAYHGGWYSRYFERSDATVSSSESIIFSDVAAAIQHYPTLAAFINSPPIVVLVAADQTNEQAFFEFLGLVVIEREGIQ